MAEQMGSDHGELALAESVVTQVETTTVIEFRPEVSMDDFMTFTPFPRLPTELREMVWEVSVSEPRIFIVKVPRDQIHARLDAKSRAVAVPATLHACFEARVLLLKRYVPFAARWGRLIYFDCGKDILRLVGQAMPALCEARNGGNGFGPERVISPVDVREWQVQLRHLELVDPYGWGLDTQRLKWMKSLETLAIEKRPTRNRWRRGRSVKDKHVAADILARLSKHWLGPKAKLPVVTFFEHKSDN
ncbi:hypothetical protein BKA61DRAFT_700604 [Leptodontidium sp. MPI-SDFR-AT-0119]|nr:hypothetical protein BKA61DRAFT_700604 [Leptodontidium sp. MPI-SDFR-AT-0119]